MTYTAGSTLVRTVMSSVTGLVRDQVVNDWAFEHSGAPSAAQYADLADDVGNFFRTVTGSGFAVGKYISAEIDRAATHRIDVYHIVAGPLGSPVYSTPWLGPVAAGSVNGLPTECAAVLSFHADLSGALEEVGATRPRARRRGRIFVGPLSTEAVDIGTPPYRLNSTFLGTCRGAALDLGDAALADGFVWSVWSRQDATLREIIGGWTDNAPDTQRRRGVSSSARVAYTV